MKSKRTLIVLGTVALLAVVAFAGLRWFSFRFWEATLMGPFTGAVFTGALSSQPTSTLPLSGAARLEFYEVPEASVPVLVLRRGSAVQWSRLLLPQRQEEDGSISTAAIRDARFRRCIFATSGVRVFFTCDWDWGGHEGGLIHLSSDLVFDHFGISW